MQSAESPTPTNPDRLNLYVGSSFILRAPLTLPLLFYCSAKGLSCQRRSSCFTPLHESLQGVCKKLLDEKAWPHRCLSIGGPHVLAHVNVLVRTQPRIFRYCCLFHMVCLFVCLSDARRRFFLFFMTWDMWNEFCVPAKNRGLSIGSVLFCNLHRAHARSSLSCWATYAGKIFFAWLLLTEKHISERVWVSGLCESAGILGFCHQIQPNNRLKFPGGLGAGACRVLTLWKGAVRHSAALFAVAS